VRYANWDGRLTSPGRVHDSFRAIEAVQLSGVRSVRYIRVEGLATRLSGDSTRLIANPVRSQAIAGELLIDLLHEAEP